jgi:hypothetical protein
MATADWGDIRAGDIRKPGAESSFTVVEMCCNMLIRVLATEKLLEEEWWVK